MKNKIFYKFALLQLEKEKQRKKDKETPVPIFRSYYMKNK